MRAAGLASDSHKPIGGADAPPKICSPIQTSDNRLRRGPSGQGLPLGARPVIGGDPHARDSAMTCERRNAPQKMRAPVSRHRQTGIGISRHHRSCG
jgi:hypothetical protein